MTAKQVEAVRNEQQVVRQLETEAKAELKRIDDESNSIDAGIGRLKTLSQEDWKTFIESNPELKTAYQDVAKQLQLGETGDVVAKVQSFVADTTTVLGRAQKVAQWTIGNPWGIVCLITAIVVSLIVWLAADTWVEWLPAVGSRIAAVTTMVGGLLAAAAPYWNRVSQFITRAESVKKLSDSAVNREIIEQQAKLSQITLRRLQAKEHLAQREADYQRIEQRINDIESGRHLESFLHERSASADYTEELGIIAIIREDFKKLAKWLRKGVEIEGREKPIKIDRIVLYIDDLDRCPPKRVVEVLQAVHLLLAIDLFVVVVAVDPRWLLNSLRWHYRELFTSGSDKLDVSDEEKTTWQSTPHNYMDKIFQIPFTLRAMDRRGYEKLVTDMFEPTSEEVHEEPLEPQSTAAAPSPATTVSAPADPSAAGGKEPASEQPTETPTGLSDIPRAGEQPVSVPAQEDSDDDTEVTLDVAAASENDGPSPPDATASRSDALEGDDQPTPADLVADPPAAASEEPPGPPLDLKPAGLALTDIEKELLASLQPLVFTPRAAKRLINTYRLIRASLSGDRLKRFVDEEQRTGEFVAVQIQLGILIGFSSLAPNVFECLRKSHRQSFWEFVEGLRPRQKESTSKLNEFGVLSEPEAWKHDRLYRALHSLKEEIEKGDKSDELKAAFRSSDDLSAYQRWGKEVARYSFRAGHVVTTLARRG